MSSRDRHNLHDLKGACADFGMVVDLIKSGYSFDSPDGIEMIEQLEKALKLLQSHIESLREGKSQND